MSEVFVSTDEIHVDVVIPADGEILGIEVGVQGPQGPRGVPGPVGPFADDAVLVGGVGGAVSSPAIVTPAGDFSAGSVTATAATGGGVWLAGYAHEAWGWHVTPGQAHFARWADSTNLGDILTVNYTTGVVNFPNGGTAPTPAPGDNDTSVATTAFVQAALAVAGSGINQLTGDVTAGPGSGSQAASLATVNANVGTFQGLTLDGKGRVTAASNQSYLTANQTITLSGDLTGSGTVSINAQIAANAVGTMEIANSNVTYGKIQNTAAARLLGNPTGSAASPSEISLGTNLSFSGTVLNATGGAGGLSGMTAGQIPIAATATTVTSSVATGTSGNSTIVQTNASGNLVAAVMPAYTGDVTSPAGSIANTLATVNSNIGTFNNITINGKGLATAGSNTAYLTVSGVSGMTAGQIPIAATATTVTSSGNLNGDVVTNATLAATIQANAVTTAKILNANVTYAKIQNVANNRLLGNTSGSAAAPSEIVLPLAVANGGTNKTSWTTGSVAFAASTAALGEDNANLFWDDTNNRLGIGTATPTAGYRVTILQNNSNLMLDTPSVNQTASIAWSDGGTLRWGLFTAADTSHNLVFYSATASTIATVDQTTGGFQFGAPTGGSKGTGTLNALGVYANNVVLTSDVELKTDIEPLVGALPLVAAIEPRSFRWKPLPESESFEGLDGVVITPRSMMPPGFTEKLNRGFLAQEVIEVLGGAVEDGVDIGAMLATLWQAVRELSDEVAALKGAAAR